MPHENYKAILGRMTTTRNVAWETVKEFLQGGGTLGSCILTEEGIIIMENIHAEKRKCILGPQQPKSIEQL